MRSEEHTSELQSPCNLVCPSWSALPLHDALPILRLRQAELAGAAARTHAEQAAGGQRAHGIVGLEGVALAEQEAVDARGGDVIGKIGKDHPGDRRRAQ